MTFQAKTRPPNSFLNSNNSMAVAAVASNPYNLGSPRLEVFNHRLQQT